MDVSSLSILGLLHKNISWHYCIADVLQMTKENFNFFFWGYFEHLFFHYFSFVYLLLHC